MNESAVTRICRKNTAGQRHRCRRLRAAADQVPICWSLDFRWTLLYMPIRVLISDFCKVRIGADTCGT